VPALFSDCGIDAVRHNQAILALENEGGHLE
jgi:hypothetical protein